MRIANACSIVLVLGFVSAGVAQMSPDEGEQRLNDRVAAVQTTQPAATNPSPDFTSEQIAKAHYDRQIENAKRDYWTAVLKADEAYVGNLDAAIKQAMTARDLDLAERLDAERKDAIARMTQHRSLLAGASSGSDVPPIGGMDLNGYRLVKAVWYVPNVDDKPVIDVTERIKPILRENSGDVQASINLFSDPLWGPHKELRIEYLRPNGQRATVIVPEYSNIPKFDLPWDIPLKQTGSSADEVLIRPGQ